MTIGASSAVRVGIVGAGSMGAGIAALTVGAGFETVLYDVAQDALERGRQRVHRLLTRAIERGGLAAATAARDERLLRTVTELRSLAGCTLILEAVPEIIDLKTGLLAELARIAPAATLASNTSSIQVSTLAAQSGAGSRLVGLHFFNPPERMRLVELIDTGQVEPEHLQHARDLAEALGKQVITVRDSPGFLVNRCARPYYLEALRIVEDDVASVAAVDRACVQQGGFPLGPFELMDLIGIDVSLAVTRAMYVQADGEPRWRPSTLQRSMVASGRLGRKTGGGFYADGRGWREDDGPRDADADAPGAGAQAIAGDDALLERVVAQLVNEATFAVAEGIATADAIDQAMVIGLNHPCGPGEWSRRLGVGRIVSILDALWDQEHDPRYRVAPLLRRQASA